MVRRGERKRAHRKRKRHPWEAAAVKKAAKAKDGGRESRGHEEDVRRTRGRDAEAGRVARGGGRHGRMAATGGGKDGSRAEHAGKVWKVRARPRTRGGRSRRQTKAADETATDETATERHRT